MRLLFMHRIEIGTQILRNNPGLESSFLSLCIIIIRIKIINKSSSNLEGQLFSDTMIFIKNRHIILLKKSCYQDYVRVLPWLSIVRGKI